MKSDSNHLELTEAKRALLAIRQLQAKIERLEQAHHEPIAIIGLGCRFPGGADTPETFWHVLEAGKDTITEIPSERWDNHRYYDPNPAIQGKTYSSGGGFLANLQDFDAQFFRIAPREAMSLDPQQRLLLEVSWESLESAGLAPEQLNGSRTGVFIGICGNDHWHRLLKRDPTEIDAYLTTGNTHSIASGRLSYSLGLTGPSLSVDTACSSSLVAVHLAMNSLRNSECDLALAGGVNTILLPDVSINFSKARMLSPQSRCKTFDAAADGFVRSEGCGTIILKRLSDALADGDNILAVIRGSAVNQDGRTSGLTVPHGPSQQAVIQQALQDAQVTPDRIDYIETHGTGTALGDPIEVGALGAVFGGNRSLLLGAVKANIGHSEAAAGIASLIKVVLALEHKKIPPQIHFQTPNPNIDWNDLPFVIPTQLTPWQRGEKLRMAGVSSFGFSGTNVHVVLEEAPIQESKVNSVTRPIHLFTLSAKSEKALQELVRRYVKFLAEHRELSIADVCYTANTGRSHFNYRLCLTVSSLEDLQKKLTLFSKGEKTVGVFSGRVQEGKTLTQINRFSLDDLPFTQEDWLEILYHLAKLYLEGVPIDWSEFYQNYPCRKVVLPTYPFQRQRYWIDVET